VYLYLNTKRSYVHVYFRLDLLIARLHGHGYIEMDTTRGHVANS